MESNYKQAALVREWLCAVFSSPSGSAQQEGQNFFQPCVCRLIITSPQPVNTSAHPARQLPWDPVVQDGVAFSIVCGSVAHVTPAKISGVPGGRYLVMPTDGKMFLLPHQIKWLWPTHIREKCYSSCDLRSEKVAAPLSLRSSGRFWSLSNKKLLGITEVDTFTLIKRVFPQGHGGVSPLGSLKNLR